ncbi:hypothetical protein [Yoonia sp. BS5-3]|uniref:Uncharacterized protein n=1 Tax=Yoonia phaeophyticola TaxID=3137369 RepID=A0ABZ2VBP8_9RHOB
MLRMMAFGLALALGGMAQANDHDRLSELAARYVEIATFTQDRGDGDSFMAQEVVVASGNPCFLHFDSIHLHAYQPVQVNGEGGFYVMSIASHEAHLRAVTSIEPHYYYIDQPPIGLKLSYDGWGETDVVVGRYYASRRFDPGAVLSINLQALLRDILAFRVDTLQYPDLERRTVPIKNEFRLNTVDGRSLEHRMAEETALIALWEACRA